MNHLIKPKHTGIIIPKKDLEIFTSVEITGKGKFADALKRRMQNLKINFAMSQTRIVDGTELGLSADTVCEKTVVDFYESYNIGRLLLNYKLKHEMRVVVLVNRQTVSPCYSESNQTIE